MKEISPNGDYESLIKGALEHDTDSVHYLVWYTNEICHGGLGDIHIYLIKKLIELNGESLFFENQGNLTQEVKNNFLIHLIEKELQAKDLYFQKSILLK